MFIYNWRTTGITAIEMTDLIQTWIDNKLETEELSEHGAKYYRAYLRRLLRNMDLTPEQALEKARADINGIWTQAKNSNGITPAGRHKALLAFRNWLRWNGLFPPADRLKHSKRTRRMGRLTWDEASSICNAASKPYNLIFKLMLHSGWGLGEFLEFNTPKTWAKARSHLERDQSAEYFRFDFTGRKTNDQPFYSLIPAAVLREIFASEITLPLSSVKGLPLNHERYNQAVIYLDSAWHTAAKRAPIPPAEGRIVLHELRDTFRTRCTLTKVAFEASEFALGHTLDQRGYVKSYNDEPWTWSELRKLYGPLVATEDALRSRDEQIKGLEERLANLEAKSIERLTIKKG